MRFSSPESPVRTAVSDFARTPKPFSAAATLIYTVITVALTLYLMRNYWMGNRLQTLWYPVETASRVVTASMLVYDGLPRFPAPLKPILEFLFVDKDELPRECARILRETIDFVGTNDAMGAAKLQGQLAVILAETGATSEALQVLPATE